MSVATGFALKTTSTWSCDHCGRELVDASRTFLGTDEIPSPEGAVFAPLPPGWVEYRSPHQLGTVVFCSDGCAFEWIREHALIRTRAPHGSAVAG